MESFLDTLPTAATNPLAFAAYIVTVAAWFVIGLRTRRITRVLAHLEIVPEGDRRAVLEAEMGARLPAELSPEHWLRARRQAYLFGAFAVMVLAAIALAAIAAFATPSAGTSREPALNVDFLASYTEAEAELSNTADGLLKVSNLQLLYEYQPCPYEILPPIGALIQEYRFNATLSPRVDSVSLTDKEFKYGPGEIDRFRIDLNFEASGIYRTRLAFNFQNVGHQKGWSSFRSDARCLAICFDWQLPQPSSYRPMTENGSCDELPYRAFTYIQDILDHPPMGWSRADSESFISETFDCPSIRVAYINVTTRWLKEEGRAQKELTRWLQEIPPCPHT